MDAGTDPNAAYQAFRQNLIQRLHSAEEEAQVGELWSLVAHNLRTQLEGDSPEDVQGLREMLLQFRELLQQDLQDLQRLTSLLPGFIQAAERRLQEVEYSADYRQARWASRMARLQRAFAEEDAGAAGLWTQLFAESLSQWRLDRCRELLDKPYPLPEASQFLRPLFQTGLSALSKGPPTQALGMLNYLTRKGNNHAVGPEDATRALLLVLSGRIYLTESKDYARAKADFDRAAELLPHDSRPPAALSQYYLAINDAGAAEHAARKACEQTAATPSGFISMGLLLEHKKLWRDAREWYDRALDLILRVEDPYLEITGLLAPVTGQLLLQLARRLETERPAIALKAADASLGHTLPPDGQYPEKAAHQIKGELLRRLERLEEAAESFLEAGKRYLWDRQTDLAEQVLRRSLELDDEQTDTYWFLVSALRDQAPRRSDHREIGRIGEEAVGLWQRGMAKVDPDEHEVWVLLERALLNEVLLSAEKEKREALRRTSFKENILWEGIGYVVRALLLNFKDVYSWTNLSRFLRMLRADQLTLHTTRKALECRDDNSYALEERVIILTNTGASQEAGETLEQLSRLEADKAPTASIESWIRRVRAFQNWQGGAYREVLESIDDLLGANPDDLWLANLRGICRQMLGEEAAALEDFERILEKGGSITDNPLINDNWLEIVSALFHVGLIRRAPERIDAVIAALEEVAQFPGHLLFDSGVVGQDLAMAHLARYGFSGEAGQLTLARQHYLAGIAEATNPWKITEQFQIGFHLLARTFPENEKLADCLQELKAAGQQRLEQFPDPLPAFQQIIDQTAEHARREGISSRWFEPALRILSALVQRDQGNWLKSLELMVSVRDEQAADFPEIDQGLRVLLDEFAQSSEKLAAEGRPADVLGNFEALLQYEEKLGHRDRAIALRLQLGDLCFRADRIPEALEWRRSLLDQTQDRERKEVWMRMGFDYLLLGAPGRAGAAFLEAVAPDFAEQPDWVFLRPAGQMATTLLRDRRQFWEVYDQLEGRERTADPQTERVLDLAQSAIPRFLEKDMALRPEDSKAEGYIPMVNPVILEISEDLRPAGDSGQWPIIVEHYPAMQKRIHSELGFWVPDLRMRTGGGSLSPASYLILLDEAPMRMGAVNPDQHYCPHAVEALADVGIPADQLTTELHPVKGTPGLWAPARFAERIRERGLELWEDPLRYPLSQLEAMVRRYLVQFVSVQATQDLLGEWQAESGAKALIQRTLPGREEVVVFTQLLKALLQEQVAIKDWKSIMEALDGQLLEADRLPALLCKVREHLLPYLPGNRSRDRVWPLPREIERQFEPWLWEVDGKEVLALPPEDTQQLLADIREFVGHDFQAGVLVVQNERLRWSVRRLIELEFPHLYAIAQSELLNQKF